MKALNDLPAPPTFPTERVDHDDQMISEQVLNPVIKLQGKGSLKSAESLGEVVEQQRLFDALDELWSEYASIRNIPFDLAAGTDARKNDRC